MEKKAEVISDRRIRKTKKALRDGLTKLMSKKSIKDISVKELTDEVDLNRGTFYLHYKDVFDMIEQIETELLKEFLLVLNLHKPKDLYGKPFPLLKDIFIFLKENADMCAALLSSNGDISFVNRFKEVVREKVLSNWMEFFNPEKADKYVYYSNFLLSGCIGLFETWLKNGLIETPEQMAMLTQELILHGPEILR